ncbi:MAG: hypothetical protein IIW48_04435 [Clostridia bacterium]|nr:hypothetical protein [Clostridia bacterium]
MDQIMEMLKEIDWEAVIATVKEIVTKIQDSGIVDQVVAAVKDLVAMISA